jgi:3-hydroxyacyl-CoA dehydrogenase
MLNDGKWHKLVEIQRMAKTDEDSIQRIVEFLSKYEFVTVDQTKGKMKLNEAARFLAQTPTA